MQYQLSRHAVLKVNERNITKNMLDDSLQNPTKILYNKKENKFLIKNFIKNRRNSIFW